jgi:membrane protease subunit (stomatin/prohibitin family)
LTALWVALMALGLAAAVGYPLLKGVKEEALPAFAAESVVQDGVTYTNPDDLALDRALGRVGREGEAVTVARAGLEEALEQQVMALRRQRQAAPVADATRISARNCPQCGQSHDTGDRFCARCGALLIQACPNCGHAYHEGDLFCARCGQRLQVGGDQ